MDSKRDATDSVAPSSMRHSDQPPNINPPIVSTLSDVNPKSYARTPVPFQRPVEITCFSYDADRTLLLNSDVEMKFYAPVDLSDPIQCDLNGGYPHRYRQRDESVPEHLDALMAALDDLEKRSEGPGVHHDLSDVDFVTWRGIMTKVRNGWMDEN